MSVQRLIITTRLPSSLISSTRPKRHCMMRTTSHAPDPGQTLTFPVNSVQHQMALLTLVTHIFLSSPSLKPSHMSWNIVRQPHTNHQTLHLILATLTLQRYQSIWYTSTATMSPDTPTYWMLPFSDLSSQVSVPSVPPRPSPSTHHTLPTSQLLLPPLIHDDVPHQHTSATLYRQYPSICLRPTKRSKTQPTNQNHTPG